VKNTNLEASHYAVLSIFYSLHPSQIFLHSTLRHTQSLFFNMKHQVSHPWKTKSYIVIPILYCLHY